MTVTAFQAVEILIALEEVRPCQKTAANMNGTIIKEKTNRMQVFFSRF